MKEIVQRIVFLAVVWLVGWWIFNIVKKDYVCDTVFPEAEYLDSCRQLFEKLHTLIDPKLLEKITEADSGVLFLSMSYYVIMSSISIGVLYLGHRKKRRQ